MKPVLLFLLAALPAWAAGPKKLLYVTQTAGFKHESVPTSVEVMKELAGKTKAFEVTVMPDVSALTRETLRKYDAVMFNTTGELPMSAEQKQAFLDFVKKGRGFLGVHSATDTFYQWPEYGELIGGYFVRHPWNEEVNVLVEDPRNPIVGFLAPSFRIADEIYVFRNFSPLHSHVLLRLDTSSVDLKKAKETRDHETTYPLAWVRSYGKGRVFYIALGHRNEVWRDERFQKLLVNGIHWATGGK